MQAQSTVTQKGQITLPKSLRLAVGINIYDKVIIKKDNNQLIIKPSTDILDIAGSIVPRKNRKKSPLVARSAHEKTYTRI